MGDSEATIHRFIQFFGSRFDMEVTDGVGEIQRNENHRDAYQEIGKEEESNEREYGRDHLTS